MTAPQPAKAEFPKSFWTANVIELFERAAYYSMASFMVIYLNEKLGMSPSLATTLNSSVLWAIIYLMPIVSGTLADKFGYKRSLGVSFVMIVLGYAIMGNLQRLWPGLVGAAPEAAVNYLAPVLLAIILIGLGGSIVKPCIAGTIQKTSGLRSTLGFGIFYMVINIGSITGRSVSYVIRTNLGIPAIFTYAATAFAVIGLIVTLLIYREPQFVSDGKKDGQTVQKKTVGQALLGILIVLRNVKFVFFIVVLALFWFLYIQLYNLMPLFMRHVDPNAPMELYTMANPIMIVCFQMLITRMVKRWTPIRTIITGAVVVTIGMFLNVLPALLAADIKHKVDLLGLAVPFAGLFLLLSIASMAVGEMLASPRIYEYVGAIAPRGQEGLYMGYVNLPLAIGSFFGGRVGGKMFEHFIADPVKAGQAPQYVPMWLIITGVGLASIIGLAVYDRTLRKSAAT